MRFTIALLLCLFLLACGTSDEITGMDVVEVEEVIIVEEDAVEKVEIEEKEVIEVEAPGDKLEADVKRERRSMTFVNINGISYVVPNDRRYYRERKSRIDFDIFTGSTLLLGVGEETRVVRFSDIDTTMKKLIFTEMQEEDVVHTAFYTYIEANIKDLFTGYEGSILTDSIGSTQGFFDPDTFAKVLEMNPKADFEVFADIKTLGKGKLKIKDFGEFTFYVGLKPGNPIVMDLNGDEVINQSKVLIHIKNGNVIDLSPYGTS